MNRKKILIPIIILTAIIIILIIVLNNAHRYNTLSISEDKWNSIIEERSRNKYLSLKWIKFNDYNLAIDKYNNKIYYSLINNSKTKYNPNVSFSTNADGVKLAILSDEMTDEKVHSNYEFKIMIYTSNEYHINKLICTDFPILNITYKNAVGENKNKNIDIDIYLFDNLENSTNRVTMSNGKLDIIKSIILFLTSELCVPSSFSHQYSKGSFTSLSLKYAK